MAEKEGKEAAAIRNRYSETCDILIEGLVDSQDFSDFVSAYLVVCVFNPHARQNVVYCIKTVYLFSTAHPGVISFSKATTLLPYLKNPSNVRPSSDLSALLISKQPEEQLISDYLLKIFRASIPLMPKTAAKFGAELQQTLQPMIAKPSSSGGLLVRWNTTGLSCRSCSVGSAGDSRLHVLCRAELDSRLHSSRRTPQVLQWCVNTKIPLYVPEISCS